MEKQRNQVNNEKMGARKKGKRGLKVCLVKRRNKLKGE